MYQITDRLLAARNKENLTKKSYVKQTSTIKRTILVNRPPYAFQFQNKGLGGGSISQVHVGELEGRISIFDSLFLHITVKVQALVKTPLP